MKDVYVITGGGSGMGLAIAKELGKRGAVLICGRTLSKLEKALAELKAAGIEAYGQACDMSDRASVTSLAEYAHSLGNIKALVNAAGISASMGSCEKVIDINLNSVVNSMQVFKPYLQKGSVVINIGSCTAYMYPMPAEALALVDHCEERNVAAELAQYANGDANLAYGFSKVLLVNYSKNKTLEFAAQGCRVVTVSPGAVLTDVMNAEMENEATKQFVASIPVGRVGQPEDIAYLCDFLASDKAGYITGVDIVIDGGSLALIAAYAKQQQ